MRADGGDLERTASPFLAAQVGEVGRGGLGVALLERLEAWCRDLAAEVCDDLAEVTDRDGLDAGERRLRRRLRRADDMAQTRAARSLGDGERARDRPDATVERQLADRGVLGEPFGRELPRRAENGE